MPTSMRVVSADPRDVWRVLADPDSYGRCFAGLREGRGVEGPWPRPRSRLRSERAVGPLTVDSVTTSVAATAPRRLELQTRAGALGRSSVDVSLVPVADGTEVRFPERVVGPTVARLAARALARAKKRRN